MAMIPYKDVDDEPTHGWLEDSHGRRLSADEVHEFFADTLRASEDFQNWTPETDGIPRAYSPQEIAKAWNVSDEFIRLLFMNEPGVLRFNKTGKSRKRTRSYTTIRIPKPVMIRVFKKWQKVTRSK